MVELLQMLVGHLFQISASSPGSRSMVMIFLALYWDLGTLNTGAFGSDGWMVMSSSSEHGLKQKFTTVIVNLCSILQLGRVYHLQNLNTPRWSPCPKMSSSHQHQCCTHTTTGHSLQEIYYFIPLSLHNQVSLFFCLSPLHWLNSFCKHLLAKVVSPDPNHSYHLLQTQKTIHSTHA